MSSITQELIRENGFRLWHDYLQGGTLDFANSNNDGVATGATYFNRGGIALDGTTGYVDVTDDNTLSPGNGSADSQFTIGVIVNSQSLVSTPLITKGVYNTSGEYRLGIESDGKIYFNLYDESEADCYIGRLFNTAVSDKQGSDLFIAGTYGAAGTSSSCSIYLNGVQVDDTDNENNPGNYVAMENLGANLFVGRNDSTYANATFGHSFYVQRTLTALEIAQLYSELINQTY